MPVQRLVPRCRAMLYSAINTGHYRGCPMKGPRDFLAARKGTEVKPSGSLLCKLSSSHPSRAGMLCAGCSLSCNYSRRETRAPRHPLAAVTAQLPTAARAGSTECGQEGTYMLYYATKHCDNDLLLL